MRETSIRCYNEIKAEGLLSKMRFQVYKALFDLGKPSTAREVDATMNVAKMEATRFTELRNLGVIYEKGTRKCSITNRMAIEWDLTDNLPIKYDKPKKTTEKIKELLSMVRELESNTFDMFAKSDLKKIITYIKENFRVK